MIFTYMCNAQDDLSGVAQCLTSNDPASIPKTVIFFSTKALVLRAYMYLQNRAYHKRYVGAYHSTLREETKQFVARSFSSATAEMRCVCSTIAFGMVSNIYWCEYGIFSVYYRV